MQKFFILFNLSCFLLAGLYDAQAQSTALEDEIKSLRKQMDLMQQRLQVLESQQATQQKEVQPASKPIAKWLPDIGIIADTVFTQTSTKEDGEGANRLSLRELELVFGSAVDPYSRLDATVSFSDEEEPSLEEAYLTRFDLPLGTTARLGKFKPKVGKVLGVHRDGLDTVDEPLVIQRYFGIEGLSKSGLDLTKNLDLPLPLTQQLVVGVLEGGNGEDGTAFGTTRRAPTLYGHLKNYMDLSATTGLEIGFSPMIGSSGDEPGFDAQVFAADMTLTQQLGTSQALKWQNEVFNLNRKTTGVDYDSDGVADIDVEGNLWGAYSLLDYRFHSQWSAGLRYDYVQLVDHDPALNPRDNDNAQTAYLTFYQSEFARWRLQYTHKNLTTGKDDNTVYLQGTFAIGNHKHKIQ